MTKEQIEAVLRGATPRPWQSEMLAGLSGTNPHREYTAQESIANWSLVRLAVNSYEAHREALALCLSAMAHAKHRNHDPANWCDGCNKLDEALARVKELGL